MCPPMRPDTDTRTEVSHPYVENENVRINRNEPVTTPERSTLSVQLPGALASVAVTAPE